VKVVLPRTQTQNSKPPQMKKILLTCSLAFAAMFQLDAQIIKSGNITTSETWTSNNIYILNGWVYVKAGATVTIQPGTIIKGDFASQGALIVERDAKLVANGTADMPIVFTSQKSVGLRNYGDWGGVIICGRGSLNQPANASLGTQQGEAVVEGGVGTIYGGAASPNDDDSSGVLRYVRIEYPGIAFQPNSEINGLTCCAVGRKTVIEHVQVSYSGDDSFEFFGGAVNCKWLIAYRGWDDEFDTDFGFHGHIQFGISIRDPNIADQSGSNGFESDNDATGTTNTPFTQPIFSNMTVVGPLAFNSSINSNYKRALHLRRNTRTCAYNSVFMGYPTGLLIESSTTQTNATNNDLQWRNNVLAGIGTDTLATTTAANPNNTNGAFFIGDANLNNGWFGTAGFSNTNFTAISSLMFNNVSLTSPDFRLMAGSPLETGASFTNTNLSDPFFTQTTYRGAFDGTNNWAACWTEFDPQNQAYNAALNNAFTVTATAQSATTFCQGGSVTLDAGSYAGATYLWSNGATTQTTSVTASGTYSVTVTKSNGCVATSNGITVMVNALPATPTITANGPVTFCNGGSVDLTSSATTGITWSNNATASTITVNSTGSYDVTVTDANGCQSTSVATMVTVNANPSAPAISTSGPTTFCTGDSVVLTSSAATGNLWSPNNETSQSITVATSGTYDVTYTDANGCSATSPQVTVSESAAPAPTITIAGSTSLCPGETVTLTASTSDTYLWSNGATTQSITVGTAGTYTVTTTNTNPCNGTGPSSGVSVTVLSAPAASFTSTVPVLNQYQFNNTSTGGTIYAWDFGDANQSSAQNPVHVYTTSGTYTVTLIVTGSNGCTDTATQVLNVGVGVQEVANVSGITMYPNPANDNLTIEIGMNEGAKATIVIFDLSGNVIVSETQHLGSGSNTLTYDVANWSNGIYFVRITSGTSVTTLKEVIAH
jgi:PKD repeat protein